MPLVGLVEALLVVVPPEFKGYSSLANVPTGSLTAVDPCLIHLAGCLAFSIQWTAILPISAVTSIGCLVLLLVQQEPGVVARNEESGVAYIQCLGVENFV